MFLSAARPFTYRKLKAFLVCVESLKEKNMIRNPRPEGRGAVKVSGLGLPCLAFRSVPVAELYQV
uniref:Uncharacterized protein n=1 Tax=Escherichia coli TaxID=562 RepID=A0A385EMY8_ECOLX|nr:Hypothetical protein pECSIC9_00022 [Escherichia coli]